MVQGINFTYIGLGILGGVFFFLLGYLIRKYAVKRKVKQSEEKAKTILAETKREADNRRREIELEAKDLMYKMRSDFDNETKDKRHQLTGVEKRLHQKEENLDKKVEKADASAGKDADADAGASAAEEDVSEDEDTFRKRFAVLIAVRDAAKKERVVPYKTFLQNVRSVTEDPHMVFSEEGALRFAIAAIAYEDAQAAVDNLMCSQFRGGVGVGVAVDAQAQAQVSASRSKKRART